MSDKIVPPGGVLSREEIEEAKRAATFGVGYRRPPVTTQFQKGQSGNPKGRPRRAVSETDGCSEEMQQLVLDAMRRKLTVKDAEGSREITVLQAVIRKQQQTALNGNPQAQRDILDRTERAMAAEQREIESINESALRYQAAIRAKIETASVAGQRITEYLPHPDDIIVRPGRRIEFIGPVCEVELAAVRKHVALRDALLLQAAMEEKLCPDDDALPVVNRRRSALGCAFLLNTYLPVRFRMEDEDFMIALYRNLHIPKVRLLKEVRRTWRGFGVKVQRGRVLPEIGAMGDRLGELSHFARRVLADLQDREQRAGV
jgi:Family of unknown function (DUF5681)